MEPVLEEVSDPSLLNKDQAALLRAVRGEQQDSDGDWAVEFILAEPPPRPSSSRSPSASPAPPPACKNKHFSFPADSSRQTATTHILLSDDEDETSSCDSDVVFLGGGGGGAGEAAQTLSSSSLKRGRASGIDFAVSLQEREGGEERWNGSISEASDDMFFRCHLCHKNRDLDLSYPMPKCTCLFCSPCMGSFVEDALNSITARIEQGEKDFDTMLLCPDESCTAEFPILQAQELAPEAFRRWESVLSDTVLNSHMDMMTCPSCGIAVEMVPSEVPEEVALSGVPEIDKTVPYIELDSNGSLLSREALCHRLIHRFRCAMCKENFCGNCRKVPYHLGKTCEEQQAEAEAGSCLYCGSTRTRGQLSAEEKATWTVHDLRRYLEQLNVDLSWCIEKSDLWKVYGLVEMLCGEAVCMKKLRNCCTRVHDCGHPCGGVRGEGKCLPCLEDPCREQRSHVNGRSTELPSSDDFCPICWVEPLKNSPSIELSCGHILHRNCAVTKVRTGCVGPELSFAFLQCPICAAEMKHPALSQCMAQPLTLKTKVRKMAIERLRADRSLEASADLKAGGAYEGREEALALRRFMFYECSKCREPYFGGDRQCAPAAERMEGINNEREQRERDRPVRRFSDLFRFRGGHAPRNPLNGNLNPEPPLPEQPRRAEALNPETLICGTCVARSIGAGRCVRGHGDKYVEFKCRFCCSVASYFCFGTTHFCNTCHMARPDVHKRPLPQCNGPRNCPLHISHPPNGQEFCLGCALCRLEMRK